MVITTEQVASYIAGQDLELAYKVANTFLLYMITDFEAPIMDRLQDTSLVVTAIYETAERHQDVIPPEEAGVTAVADAIVLANRQLAERRREFDGNIESLATDWAKIGHAADVVFSDRAAELREGELTIETYRYVCTAFLKPSWLRCCVLTVRGICESGQWWPVSYPELILYRVDDICMWRCVPIERCLTQS